MFSGKIPATHSPQTGGNPLIPARHAPVIYSLFRIVFGMVFFFFGLQKLFGWFGGPVAPPGSLQQAAGVVETLCGALVMVGLFTRQAAFLASGEMAIAFWYIHVSLIAAGKGLGFPAMLVPHLNGGVDATMLCFAFLYIATRGAGVWSVDAIARGKS
jgi:putative oxidoreductase